MPETPDAAGRALLERFLHAINSGDAEAEADVFHYPLVRLASGTVRVWETREALLAAVPQRRARREAEGWHHSVMHSVRAVHAGEDKVHLAIVNDRCRADGTVYRRFDTLWIATLEEGRWGIRFRSSFQEERVPAGDAAAAASPQSNGAEEAAEAAAIGAVQAFQTAFRGQDNEALAAALNYPHVRLAKGGLERYETPADFLASRAERNATLRAEGWHTTVTRSLTVVQRGPDKVHLAITNDRCDADGTPYLSFDTLWVATCLNGHWGIQARSSFLRR